MTDATIAETALRIADPTARAAYLDLACGDEPGRRARVDALLEPASTGLGPPPDPDEATVDHTPVSTADAVDTRAIRGAPDEAPTAEASGAGNTPAPRPIAEGPGSTIGPYRLLDRLGEGGMGSVFLAEQVRPVRRQVALKIIKPGMDTEQVIARFEAERQALALMEHPNIARVLDAGTTDTGRPYFVMEPVRGQTITRYCDENRLTPRQRLELMVPVCQAVQHAHQKGIIHRDLKPSNVLVAEVDGRPAPKVIDFGIAKATDRDHAERAQFTQVGAVVGTPEYMSPEQAGLGAGDVDTRADVYSLGVMLYELLTGTTPIDRLRLRRAGWAEMLRVIREEEPPTPSSRLTGQHDSLPSASAVRGTEPARLARMVRGELDWIVMKCLEKERDRRYETANALSRDIQRYLADEPVEAGPPSRTYRLRKFARKNRGLLLTGAAIGATLLVATAVSSGLAYWAVRSRDRAVLAEGRARESATRERDARSVAEARLGQLEKATVLLGSVFNDLSADRVEKEGKDLRVLLGERLGKASEELVGDAIGDPRTVATVQNVLGLSLLSLGYPDRAFRVLERASRTQDERLGPDDPTALMTRGNLARAHYDLGHYDEAIAIYEPTLDRLNRLVGEDDPDALRLAGTFAWSLAMSGRVDRALPLFERVLRQTSDRLGPDHRDTLASRGDLAAAYRMANRVGDAIVLMERAVEVERDALGPENSRTLASLTNLGDLYHAAGRYDDAIKVQEPSARLLEQRLGPDHPTTLTARGNLAASYLQSGRAPEAVALFERVVAGMTAKLGPDHPETLNMRGNLATAYNDLGRADESIAAGRETLRLTAAKLGPDHPRALAIRNNLAAALIRTGHVDEAAPMLEANLPHVRAAFGPSHPNTKGTEAKLLGVYRALDRWPDAERLIRSMAEVPGRAPGDRINLAQDLAEALSAQEKWAEAAPLWRESLEGREAAKDPSWSLDVVRSRLGLALAKLGRLDEAGPLIARGYEGLVAHRAQIPPRSRSRIAEAARAGVFLEEARRDPREAERWRERLREASFPDDPFQR